ncbi:MAG: hypothetical protein ACE5IE_05640 [Dehalococcoidia bacterium]
MARKRVSHYALFQNVGDALAINVYYQGGGADTVDGLSVEEADYLVDLLRHEKPVDYDHSRRRFLSGAPEPVGEVEPTLNLDDWLATRPAIANAIVWQAPGGSTKAYPAWSASEKYQLFTTFQRIRLRESPGLPAAPPLTVTPGPTDNVATRLAPDLAWNYYLAYIAQSLAAEAGEWLRWSISGYTVDQLALLLDSRSLFSWEVETASYNIPFNLGAVTPGDPVRTFAFLGTNELIAWTPRQAVERLIGWCRNNLVHFSGGWDTANAYNQWQYYGFPPVERIISGTVLRDHPEWGNAHRTGGCWGTTGFLRAVLRTVNIPVTLETRCGHALPYFVVRESAYLSHGDDPYNALSKATPPFPAGELLTDQAKFDAWFGASVPTDTMCKNIGRRTRELAIQYLPNYLLYKHCSDLAAGRDRASSQVYDIFKDNYTLAALEAANLWGRMDAKIASFGGCAHVP